MSTRRLEIDDFRIERDSIGTYPVPKQALYGIHTARAFANFPISGISIGALPELIAALARIKKAACSVNAEQGVLPAHVVKPIIQACDEVASGQWNDQFVVDVFQGGAGTSTNMNVNEVVANRALMLLGKDLGDYNTVDPIGHVNRSQSTNDCYGSAIRLATYNINLKLVSALGSLTDALDKKAVAFVSIEKLGRTQLQDAVPMTICAEIGAFAATLRKDCDRLRQIPDMFLEINLGGTAIGSGVGASRAYRDGIIQSAGKEFCLPIVRAGDLYEASWDMGDFVLYSSLLKRLAVKLSKISNDLRLLSSGPRGGIGELILPPRQAGSSLMPGKINPVIPEAVNQVAFRVFGLDTSITFAAESGQLQLNAFEPLIYASIDEAVTLLTASIDMLREHCINGLEVNAAECRAMLDASTARATEASETMGYDRAAMIARHVLHSGKSWDKALTETAD